MPEATKTTTRPSRARKAAPAAAKAAPAPATAEPIGRVKVELEYIGDTAKYSKFGFPEGVGVVGNVYAPIGTKRVAVLVTDDSDAASE